MSKRVEDTIIKHAIVKDRFDELSSTGKCNCCGKSNVPVVVLASSIGPISFAYCRDCLNKGVEPYGALVAFIGCALSSDKIDNYEDELIPYYVDLINRCLEFYNKSREDFVKEMKENVKEWEEYANDQQGQ